MENVYIPGSRIFLGNLASDHTSEREVRDMFLRYGNVKEVVIRKGFGFVQFDSADAAQKAIDAENGKTFRGYRLDVSLATGESRKTTDKPRESSRTELPRPEPRPLPRPEPRELRDRSRDMEARGREVERSRDSRERRDRKRSRSRDWNDDRASKRAHISPSHHYNNTDTRHGHYSHHTDTRGHRDIDTRPSHSASQCDVLYDTPLLSSLAQDLCVEIERVVRTSTGTQLRTAWHHVPARELDAELRSHERRQVPYVCVLRESYSANIRDFRLRRKGDYFLDLFLLDVNGRYRDCRDTEYEVVCDMIASAETQQSAINSNTNYSAAQQLSLLTLLTQLQQQQAMSQPSVPATDLTALLGQLAPLLSAQVTPVINTTPLAVSAPVVPAQNSRLQDLNSLVQQLIQSELHALAAPSPVPANTAPGSSTDLLQSLLGAVNSNTTANVVNVRPVQQVAPQLPPQFNTTAVSAQNNTANLLSALQTLLSQSKPM